MQSSVNAFQANKSKSLLNRKRRERDPGTVVLSISRYCVPKAVVIFNPEDWTYIATIGPEYVRDQDSGVYSAGRLEAS